MSIGTSDFPEFSSSFVPHRFTVADYHRLAELGILSEDDRVELLEGVIVTKMIHNPIHDGTIELVDEVLRQMLPEEWRIRIQSSITTADSEPEPDLAIVRGPAGQYLDKHPSAGDIALVIEVADSSLDRDRHKRSLYAHAGIDTYWIVNLVDRRVEAYSGPIPDDDEPRYSLHTDFSSNDEVPVVILGQEVGRLRVSQLLPNGE